ncbi:hypothetical protein B0H14DRAFT_2602573 [Mycena olivaceomarginata]|nr:hypothetical protein B0H14DRAFT_2602573 [Mycena olivaceomarginata]
MPNLDRCHVVVFSSELSVRDQQSQQCQILIGATSSFSSFSHLTLCLSGPKSHLACVENLLVSCEGAHTAASSHCCPIPPAQSVYRLLTGLPPCQRTPGQGRVSTGDLPSSFSRCPSTSSSHVLSLRLRPPPLPAVAVLDITDTIILPLHYPLLPSSTSPAPSLSVSAACRLPPPPLPSPAALAISPTPVSVNFPHSGSLSSTATDWVTSIDQHRNQATSSRCPPASSYLSSLLTFIGMVR